TGREGCRRRMPGRAGILARAGASIWSCRMTIRSGCQFAVAPHFHLPFDWSRQLFIAAEVARSDGCGLPRQAWRPPTPDELSLLVRTFDGETRPEELSDCVCLFQLPAHLQSKWWRL